MLLGTFSLSSSKAKVRGLLEPIRSRLQWATVLRLYSSLGNTVRPCLKKKLNGKMKDSLCLHLLKRGLLSQVACDWNLILPVLYWTEHRKSTPRQKYAKLQGLLPATTEDSGLPNPWQRKKGDKTFFFF